MSGLAAFVAGFGTGYIQRKDKERDQERQDKMDKIVLDRADREARDDAEAQALKADMKDAGASQAVENMTATDVTKDDEGNDMPAVGRYRVGAARYGTQEEAQAVADKANTGDARLQRQVDTLNKHGKVNEAMALQASAKQAKLADFQLSDAERKHTDELSNRALDEEIQAAGGDTFKGLAAVGTKTSAGTMAGLEVKPVPSPDGKKISMVAVDKDGNEKVLNTYSNDQAGALAARQDFMKVDPATRIGWLHQRSQEAKSDAKDAKAEEWKQKEFDLNKSNIEFNQKMTKANLSLRQMEVGFAAQRAAREKATYDAEAKIPPAEKAKIASLDKEIEVVNKAIVDAKAKGEWNPNNPASKELMTQLERAQDRHSAALAPFMSAKSNAAADPLGMRGEAAPAPGAAPAAPAQPSQVRAAPAPAAAGPAPAAAQGVPVPAAPAAPAVAPAAAAGLRAIQSNPAAAKNIAPLADQYKAAKAQLAAVAGSGDAQAITKYANQLQAATQALESEAKKQFSGSATDVLNAIYAQ